MGLVAGGQPRLTRTSSSNFGLVRVAFIRECLLIGERMIKTFEIACFQISGRFCSGRAAPPSPVGISL